MKYENEAEGSENKKEENNSGTQKSSHEDKAPTQNKKTVEPRAGGNGAPPEQQCRFAVRARTNKMLRKRRTTKGSGGGSKNGMRDSQVWVQHFDEGRGEEEETTKRRWCRRELHSCNTLITKTRKEGRGG